MEEGFLYFKQLNFIKKTFEKLLSKELSLISIPCPLFLEKSELLNDMLNGVEKPVSFKIKNLNKEVEVVHSLAKWKRMFLYNYGFDKKIGIYTNMIAIRKDEVVDNKHSILVDQWDWEKIIDINDRNIETLHKYVSKIFKCIKKTYKLFIEKFDIKNPINLVDDIFFIDSQSLENMFPNITPKEREYQICKKHKAVFISRIGNKLNSGIKHDDRSDEYDDWELNGDLLLWNQANNDSLEISSMGIRVNKNSLLNQLMMNNKSINNSNYHKLIVNNKLPQTIGGGIGQSRLCMFMLKQKHIGNVQFSVWNTKKGILK